MLLCMGILPIAIESYGFKELTENERICQLCPHQTVENGQPFYVLVVYTLCKGILCIIMYVKDV